MPRSKKRKRSGHDASSNHSPGSSKRYTPVKKDVLQQHYPLVCTLREYVLSQLPDTSRIRRKKIAALGSGTDASEVETQLSRLLDTALVGTAPSTPKSDPGASTWEQWLSFSQKGDESYVTISKGIASSFGKQSEVCSCSAPCASRSSNEAKWPECRLLISSSGCCFRGEKDRGPSMSFVMASVEVPEKISPPGQPFPGYTLTIPTSMKRH